MTNGMSNRHICAYVHVPRCSTGNWFLYVHLLHSHSLSMLKVKASQWLGLLCQDIRGHLAALRCSMMRVQDVLQKELPFQISKEFSTIKKDDQFSAAECPMSITACTHHVKWTALFDQMDETLHEEMNHLVSLIGFSFTAWCSKRTS